MATLRTFAHPCHLQLAILRAITRLEEAVKVRCQNKTPTERRTPEVCPSVTEGKIPPSEGYNEENFSFDLDSRWLEKE